MIAPHTVWGFSLERTAAYKSEAQAKKLSQNRQWLKLNHYHKNWFGSYRSKIKGHFFLASQGAEDPDAEMQATLDALFSENKNPAQCHYLARTRWLKSVLNIHADDIVSCPERDDWKAQLSAREVYLTFASSDLNNTSSSFGHTFLRLHSPENTRQMELLDYGVNYAAITGKDTGAIFGLKGLLGLYPGNYSMLPYHQKIREYTNLEGRDIWEYKINLSEDEVALFVDHLLELDGSFSYYYFADENCSYQILEALNVVKPDLDLTKSFHDFVIPLDTVRVLEGENLLEGEKLRSSLQAEWRTRFAGLNLSQKKELKEAVKDPKDFKFTENLSNKEKAETLEASLSYLAIKEYREQKELKDDKYALAIQRAHLGLITEPIEIPRPTSPLLSQESNAAYLGYGQRDEREFWRLKYRRTFHDFIADDIGMSPFFHLEVISFDFRYFTEKKNLDLQQFTLVNILSTSPTNILDHPLSWSVDIGTMPKLNPYLDFGVGTSFDLAARPATRWTLLAKSESRTEEDHYAGFAGIENILLTKWSKNLRSLLTSNYLYNFQTGGFIWDNQAAISISEAQNELRLEYKNRQNIPDWQASVIRYF